MVAGKNVPGKRRDGHFVGVWTGGSVAHLALHGHDLGESLVGDALLDSVYPSWKEGLQESLFGSGLSPLILLEPPLVIAPKEVFDCIDG